MAKKLQLVNGVPRMRDESNSVIYDETVTISSGGVTTGDPVTLPSSETYENEELWVMLNGQQLEPVIDYNYEGSIPRTQVSFTFDLVEDDLVRFRKERPPEP